MNFEKHYCNFKNNIKYFYILYSHTYKHIVHNLCTSKNTLPWRQFLWVKELLQREEKRQRTNNPILFWRMEMKGFVPLVNRERGKEKRKKNPNNSTPEKIGKCLVSLKLTLVRLISEYNLLKLFLELNNLITDILSWINEHNIFKSQRK